MVYSDFAIDQLLGRLAEVWNRISTSKCLTADLLEAIEVIRQLRTKAAPPTNGPLTPEELRELEEDWVWIELLVPFYRMESGYYRKRSRFSDADKFCCGYPNVVIRDLPYSLYGDTWLAYRRRPEEPRPEPAPPAWREHLLRRFERAE